MIDYKITGITISGIGKAHETLVMQKPHFKDIFNIDKLHDGTINLNISPILITPI